MGNKERYGLNKYGEEGEEIWEKEKWERKGNITRLTPARKLCSIPDDFPKKLKKDILDYLNNKQD
jgi:hypothetical protein